MSRQAILKLTEGIYVGYNPSYTLETAVFTASRRFNEALGTRISPVESMKLMEGENVISCGGLDNYLVKLYEKMAQTKAKKKSA